MATLAGVATVVSVIVAVLVIFLNKDEDQTTPIADGLNENLVAAIAGIPLEICQCPNGIGKLACVNDTRYDCDSCNLGFMKLESGQNRSICVETCKNGEKLDNTTNRCIKNECYRKC